MTLTPATSRFTLSPLAIQGVVAIKRLPLSDARGHFTRLFCADDLATAGWVWPVEQINLSYTGKTGTLRGMHYQSAPHSEAKLVACLRGRVWDVAVDLRATSPTFMQWCAQELSADDSTALLIPSGCAHGFQTLSDDAELLYVHSAPYVPSADAGLNPQDQRLAIEWPLPVSTISEKDAQRPMLSADFKGLQP